MAQNYKALIFTFQYGSTLMGDCMSLIYNKTNIYIPIWFYFNKHTELTINKDRYNLHSNMVLL